MEISEKLDELNRTWESEFKSVNDKIDELKKTKGHAPADYEEKLAKIDQAIEKQMDEVEKLKSMANRAIDDESKDDETISKEAKAAFNKFLARGEDRLTAEDKKAIEDAFGPEYKALSVDSQADGGYFVLPERATTIVKRIYESSPIRQLAATVTIGSDAYEEPVDFDEAGSGWVGERDSRSETTTPQIKLLRIQAHELYAEPRATQKLLDDASIDSESWLGEHVAMKFARDEATAFVTGDGNGKPRGILSYPDYTVAGTDEYGAVERIASGASGAVSADGLIDLQTALFEEFQMNASWLMKRATAGAVRKLKDADNRYLWSFDGGIVGDKPMSSLLGKPVYFGNDMPAVAASALSIAYGDFRAGYLIVDRIGIRVLRDPFTAKPYVKFYTTKRVGGAMRQFQAIKLLEIDT